MAFTYCVVRNREESKFLTNFTFHNELYFMQVKKFQTL